MGIDRRGFLGRLTAGLGALTLGGCDKLSEQPWLLRLLSGPEALDHWLHRTALPQRLAPEYTEAEISPRFRANGSADPADPDYRRLAESDFREWRLRLGGLVERPGASPSTSCVPCPRAPRSPATTASRDGVASASGPACRWPHC